MDSRGVKLGKKCSTKGLDSALKVSIIYILLWTENRKLKNLSTYTWWDALRWRCLSCDDVKTGMHTDLDLSLTILIVGMDSSSLPSLSSLTGLPPLPRRGERSRPSGKTCSWCICVGAVGDKQLGDVAAPALLFPPPFWAEADEEEEPERPRSRDTSFISRHSMTRHTSRLWPEPPSYWVVTWSFSSRRTT